MKRHISASIISVDTVEKKKARYLKEHPYGKTSQKTLDDMFQRYLVLVKEDKHKWRKVTTWHEPVDAVIAEIKRFDAALRQRDFERARGTDYSGSWAAHPRQRGNGTQL